MSLYSLIPRPAWNPNTTLALGEISLLSEIAAYLSSHPGTAAPDIATALGHTELEVESGLTKLVIAGIVGEHRADAA